MREIAPALGAEQVVLSIVAGATLRTLADGLAHPPVVRADAQHAGPDPSRDQRLGGGRGLHAGAARPGAARPARAGQRARGGGRGRSWPWPPPSPAPGRPTCSPSWRRSSTPACTSGFPRELAHDLVVATLVGSAEYAAQSDLHPAQLRNAVTSPGGTSAAAIYELEKGRIRTVLSDAVWAAYRRTHRAGRAPRGGGRPRVNARRAGSSAATSPCRSPATVVRIRETGHTGSARPLMYAIVMAGGAGTRLWPLSRRKTPKQLLAWPATRACSSSR